MTRARVHWSRQINGFLTLKPEKMYLAAWPDILKSSSLYAISTLNIDRDIECPTICSFISYILIVSTLFGKNTKLFKVFQCSKQLTDTQALKCFARKGAKWKNTMERGQELHFKAAIKDIFYNVTTVDLMQCKQNIIVVLWRSLDFCICFHRISCFCDRPCVTTLLFWFLTWKFSPKIRLRRDSNPRSPVY